MKKVVLLIVIFIFSYLILDAQNVGIGTNSPDASAKLEILSKSKGLLIPRMTKADKSDIASPATGLLIYQTNGVEGFYLFNGVDWVRLVDEENRVKKLNDLFDAKSDIDGSDNYSSLFLGLDAGLNDDGSNNNNIGIGLEAISANTAGSNNLAVGIEALNQNTIGSENTALGKLALNGNKANNR
ncbi:MAG TPA: hypothetical protein ENI82_04955, partial [Bacteroidetes bacterium]|nr:hypothetical protein [Bacteroidota bacterium]